MEIPLNSLISEVFALALTMVCATTFALYLAPLWSGYSVTSWRVSHLSGLAETTVHGPELMSYSSFAARFGRGIPQAAVPIWFVPQDGYLRRNYHVGTKQGWPWQNC